VSAVEFHQVLDDRQTESQAAVRACEGLVGLPEPIEDERQKRGSRPTPVSVTEISTCESRCRVRTSRRPPEGVNFRELERMFQSTCCMRWRSA
jgi:hypothetical protein